MGHLYAVLHVALIRWGSDSGAAAAAAGVVPAPPPPPPGGPPPRCGHTRGEALGAGVHRDFPSESGRGNEGASLSGCNAAIVRGRVMAVKAPLCFGAGNGRCRSPATPLPSPSVLETFGGLLRCTLGGPFLGRAAGLKGPLAES